MDTHTEWEARAEWEAIYAEALNSQNTLECSECGDPFFGEAPSIVIVCYACWSALYGKDFA